VGDRPGLETREGDLVITRDRSVRRRLAGLSAIALAVIILLAGIWLGGHPSYLPGPLRGGFFESRSSVLVDQAVHIVSTRYYRPLSRSILVDRALSGMVASLDDPYSRYLDPQAYRNRNEHHQQDGGEAPPVASWQMLTYHRLRIGHLTPGSARTRVSAGGPSSRPVWARAPGR
jgi:Activating protease CtpB N-terminal domain